MNAAKKTIEVYHYSLMEDMNIHYRSESLKGHKCGGFIRRLLCRGVDIVRTRFLRNCDRGNGDTLSDRRENEFIWQPSSNLRRSASIDANNRYNVNQNVTSFRLLEEKECNAGQQGDTNKIDDCNNDCEDFDNDKVEQSSQISPKHENYRGGIQKINESMNSTSRSEKSPDASRQNVRFSAQSIEEDRNYSAVHQSGVCMGDGNTKDFCIDNANIKHDHMFQEWTESYSNCSKQYNYNYNYNYIDKHESNYNHNAITLEDLDSRSRKSIPIYFNKDFIPSDFISKKISIDDITPEMIHQFLNRDNPNSNYYAKVKITEALRENVLQSVNAIKTLFRLKGFDTARSKFIQDYNKFYLEPGAKTVNTLNEIVDRENDMRKVSKQRQYQLSFE